MNDMLLLPLPLPRHRQRNMRVLRNASNYYEIFGASLSSFCNEFISLFSHCKMQLIRLAYATKLLLPARTQNVIELVTFSECAATKFTKSLFFHLWFTPGALKLIAVDYTIYFNSVCITFRPQ